MTVDVRKHAAQCLSRLVLPLVTALGIGFTALPAQGDAQVRAFVAHALALRAAAAEGEGEAVLAEIPGGGPREHRQSLWSPFFENAVVALGRLRSPVPAALYYNPLLDVALLTRWDRADLCIELYSGLTTSCPEYWISSPRPGMSAARQSWGRGSRGGSFRGGRRHRGGAG